MLVVINRSVSEQIAKLYWNFGVIRNVYHTNNVIFINLEITTRTEEITEKHPMQVSDDAIDAISGLKEFNAALSVMLPRQMVRQMMMFYNMYPPSIVITPLEKFLWYNLISIDRNMESAGFPPKAKLIALRKENNITCEITHTICVVCMLESQSVPHNLRLTDEERMCGTYITFKG